MANILLTTFSKVFFWMVIILWLKFHWSLSLTHWDGAEQGTGYYLSQWWPISPVQISYIDRLMQERRNSITNALELHLCCTNSSIYAVWKDAKHPHQGHHHYIAIDILVPKSFITALDCVPSRHAVTLLWRVQKFVGIGRICYELCITKFHWISYWVEISLVGRVPGLNEFFAFVHACMPAGYLTSMIGANIVKFAQNMNTVSCCNNAVNHNTILNQTIQRLRRNIEYTWNSKKTPPPVWAIRSL